MEHKDMQHVKPSIRKGGRASFADIFFRGLGDLLDFGAVRRVRYDAIPPPKVTMEHGWRQVGDALRSAMKTADIRVSGRRGE